MGERIPKLLQHSRLSLSIKAAVQASKLLYM
jgi:hypothetical protein